MKTAIYTAVGTLIFTVTTVAYSINENLGLSGQKDVIKNAKQSDETFRLTSADYTVAKEKTKNSINKYKTDPKKLAKLRSLYKELQKAEGKIADIYRQKKESLKKHHAENKKKNQEIVDNLIQDVKDLDAQIIFEYNELKDLEDQRDYLLIGKTAAKLINENFEDKKVNDITIDHMVNAIDASQYDDTISAEIAASFFPKVGELNSKIEQLYAVGSRMTSKQKKRLKNLDKQKTKLAKETYNEYEAHFKKLPTILNENIVDTKNMIGAKKGNIDYKEGEIFKKEMKINQYAMLLSDQKAKQDYINLRKEEQDLLDVVRKRGNLITKVITGIGRNKGRDEEVPITAPKESFEHEVFIGLRGEGLDKFIEETEQLVEQVTNAAEGKIGFTHDEIDRMSNIQEAWVFAAGDVLKTESVIHLHTAQKRYKVSSPS